MSSGVSDNPQQSPLLPLEVHCPDALVVNVRDIVTDTAMVTGGVALRRGSVLGQEIVSGKYPLAVFAATDGSSFPCAILANDADASEGDVHAGVYLAGEFDGNSITLDPSISPLTAEASLRLSRIFVKGLPTAANP